MRIAFTGDILSYPSQDKVAHSKGYDFCYKKVLPLFKGCNYVVGSLETTCAGKGMGYTRNYNSFNTPESILLALKRCGFDMLTTANNHCLDRGIKGMENTINNLVKAGLDYTGTSNNPNSKPYLLKEINGIKVAFVAYTYGTNSENNGCLLNKDDAWRVNLFRRQICYNRKWYKKIAKSYFSLFSSSKGVPGGIQLDCAPANEINNSQNHFYINNFKKTIQEAKTESDFVICLLHIGGQFNSQPGQYTKDIVKLAYDNGADTVICNHSHTVQKVAINDNNKPCAWALGNFSFTPFEGYYVPGVYADYSIVLFCDIFDDTKQLQGVSFTICKSVVTIHGVQVIPVYDLYQEINEDERKQLKNDIQKVVEKAIGYPIENDFMVLPEYKVEIS